MPSVSAKLVRGFLLPHADSVGTKAARSRTTAARRIMRAGILLPGVQARRVEMEVGALTARAAGDRGALATVQPLLEDRLQPSQRASVLALQPARRAETLQEP